MKNSISTLILCPNNCEKWSRGMTVIMGQVVEVEIDTKNKGSKRYRGHRVERYMDNSKNRELIKKENVCCCC